MKTKDLLHALTHRFLHLMGEVMKLNSQYLHREIKVMEYRRKLKALNNSIDIVYQEIHDFILNPKRRAK